MDEQSCFGKSKDNVEKLTVTFPIVKLTSGLFSGYLSHYVSIRSLVFFGCLLASSGVFLCYFAKDIVFLIIFYGIFQGIGVGVVVILSHVIINQHFKQYRAVAMGIGYAGSSIGLMVFPLITEYLIDIYGLHGSFLMLGGIMLQSTIAATLYLSPKDQVKTVQESPCSYMYSIGILTQPMFLVTAITFCLYFFNTSIYLTIVVDFAKDLAIAEETAVALLSAFSAGDLAGRLGFGWIVDHKCVNRRNAVMVCQCLMGILMLLIPFNSSHYILVIISVALGFIGGSIIINFSVVMTDYMGLSDLPVALGFAIIINGAAAFLRPVLIGHFRDVVGQYDMLFVSVGCTQAVASISWMMEPVFKKSRNLNNQPT